jgi:hypothetical protein
MVAVSAGAAYDKLLYMPGQFDLLSLHRHLDYYEKSQKSNSNILTTLHRMEQRIKQQYAIIFYGDIEG